VGRLSHAVTYDNDERGITLRGASPLGDGGPVVVAGLTPGQGGWESRPQGEGGQASKTHQDSGGMRNAERRNGFGCPA
jgi:hypothetical protein